MFLKVAQDHYEKFTIGGKNRGRQIRQESIAIVQATGDAGSLNQKGFMEFVRRCKIQDIVKESSSVAANGSIMKCKKRDRERYRKEGGQVGSMVTRYLA